MLASALLSTAVRAAAASEPASCRTVRLADVGWTDVTATTAMLSA
jgi:glycine betaine/proline transport system substrate-binding protein